MFIVFEGIDGCGKSTQFKKFHNYLYDLSKYNHITSTREPYKSRDIRKILMSDEDPYSQKEKLTELFIEDRKEHIEEIINPDLKKGKIILCDRYKYSTICYQSAQGQNIDKLIEMHKGMPIPNLTFIFDVSVEIAFKRMEKDSREKEQKFEKDKDFLEKVRQNYLLMPKKFPNENIQIIDANRSIEEIFEEIKFFYN